MLILILLVSYVIGSIPMGYVIVKAISGQDVRTVGSGRTGGTNAMRAAGLGPLYERFVRLRKNLEGEGLFDPAAKQPIPAHPRSIGVLTSLHAAALRLFNRPTAVGKRMRAPANFRFRAGLQNDCSRPSTDLRSARSLKSGNKKQQSFRAPQSSGWPSPHSSTSGCP